MSWSRLWKWAAAGPAPSAPREHVQAPPPLRPSQLRLREQTAETEQGEVSFLDELAREQPPHVELPPEDESQISTLVLQVVRYVTQRKVEPPVVPALVPRVLAIVNEPEVDLVRLTHVIQQDLAISAKLLSVANSPMFGGTAEVKTVRQAIAHLGTEQVAQVAIGLACRSSLDSQNASASTLAARWQRQFHHAMTCAFTAASLAGKQDNAAQEAAFLGGLFHDVGQAVALRALEALLASGGIENASDIVIDEVLYRVHAYPGDEFYEKWTLPEALMALCAGHHQLEEADAHDRTFWIVNLVSSFDTLLDGSSAARRHALDEARISASKLGLSDAAVRAAHAETRALGARTARMFAT